MSNSRKIRRTGDEKEEQPLVNGMKRKENQSPEFTSIQPHSPVKTPRWRSRRRLVKATVIPATKDDKVVRYPKLGRRWEINGHYAGKFLPRVRFSHDEK